MSVGGIIQRANKQIPGPAGPAGGVTAANNGLSLDAGLTTAQLGQSIGAVGDPAALLSDREIPMAGNSFAMIDAASNRHFVVSQDAVNGRYILGDVDQADANGYLDIDKQVAHLAGGRSVAIGDLDNLHGGSQFATVGNVGGQQRIVAAMNGNEYLNLAGWLDQYYFGDFGGATNGISLSLLNDNLNRRAYLGTVLGNGMGFSINDLNRNAEVSDSLGTYFLIDPVSRVYYLGDYVSGNDGWMQVTNQIYQVFLPDMNGMAIEAKADGGGNRYVKLGDVDLANNQTLLEIDDANQLFTMKSGGNNYLSIDVVSNDYAFGDVFGAANGPLIRMLPTGIVMSADVNGVGQNQVLNIATNIDTYTIGDIDTALNGTIIRIDDANQKVFTRGTNQLIGTITGFANGAAANVGTLNNAPAAGNPTKWIPIDDNGTTRYIPAW